MVKTTETLEEVAKSLADTLGDDRETVLRVVTTYAAQLDVPGCFEDGLSPRVEVDEETAEAIRTAYVLAGLQEEGA